MVSLNLYETSTETPSLCIEGVRLNEQQCRKMIDWLEEAELVLKRARGWEGM
jgi:hypothetical protein